ncbi:hypothetical protein [Sphingopyxis sp. JAI128]|uniref:hypothetical protein n=1 Tax=Sphingopyxis sp. JAI128 TaxID=2723066 RepID=UPI00161D486B|nr:hypothetical protein [Sphingopyxis sp. JAI128]MBB6427401.1 pimeloyl-ACP methyl ester carboxylesterase [Sphingopyxis sp. JAI128]
MMRVYRAPDERFAGLADWRYAPKYVEIADGLRVHYIDEGAKDAQPVPMLHGEPTWSYLYRHMIGPATRARGDMPFAARVPDAQGMAHRTLRGGHFIQEDDPAGFFAAIRDVAAGK